MAYTYGLYSHGLQSWPTVMAYSHGLHSYGLCSHGLCSYGLYSNGLYSYGTLISTPCHMGAGVCACMGVGVRVNTGMYVHLSSWLRCVGWVQVITIYAITM